MLTNKINLKIIDRIKFQFQNNSIPISNVINQPSKIVYIKLPYVRAISDQLSKEINSFSPKFDTNMQLGLLHTTCKLKKLFPYKAVVLKLFAPAAHFATFPNFAAHLDQSADLFWSALSFPRFPLPDALILYFIKASNFLCNFLLIK